MKVTSPSAAVRRRLTDLVLLLFAAGLAVCAAQFLGNRNFWLDEYFSIHLIKFDWDKIAGFASYDVHPPLYYYILKGFVSLLGTAPAIYRLASYAAYLLTLVLAWGAFRPVFGRRATLLFFCLLGINTTALHYYTEVRMYGWTIFFVLLTGFLAYRIVSEEVPSRRYWVALTAAGLATGYLHYFALLAVGLIYLALLVWFLMRCRSQLRAWGIAVGVSVLGYLPWVCLTAVHLSQQVTSFWLQAPPALQETLELIVGNRLSSWGVLALLLAACLLELILPGVPAARRWLVATALLLAVGLPAAGYAASALLHPLYLPRYFLPALGLLWLAMAVSAADLLHRMVPVLRIGGTLVLAALLLFVLQEPARNQLQEMQECNTVIQNALAYVEDRYQPDDLVYSAVGSVDQRVLDFLFRTETTAAGDDPTAAVPSDGSSLFLIYAEEDPSGDWAAALDQAGLQMDSWQGALLDNTWCRIYYYTPISG